MTLRSAPQERIQLTREIKPRQVAREELSPTVRYWLEFAINHGPLGEEAIRSATKGDRRYRITAKDVAAINKYVSQPGAGWVQFSESAAETPGSRHHRTGSINQSQEPEGGWVSFPEDRRTQAEKHVQQAEMNNKEPWQQGLQQARQLLTWLRELPNQIVMEAIGENQARRRRAKKTE